VVVVQTNIDQMVVVRVPILAILLANDVEEENHDSHIVMVEVAIHSIHPVPYENEVDPKTALRHCNVVIVVVVGIVVVVVLFALVEQPVVQTRLEHRPLALDAYSFYHPAQEKLLLSS
jgi:hypothetical protein